MKRKALGVLLAMLCIASIIPATVNAEEVAAPLSAEVTVSIINGSPVLAAEKVTVTDTDGDGKLTINDALYCAHEKKYTGGAAAGYSSALSGLGLSLTMLWGNNSGNFGYYLNNALHLSLSDEVKEGDYVSAFIYQDTTFYSDLYSYFDRTSVTLDNSLSLELTLSYIELDPVTWETTVKPAEGATVTIDGKDTPFTVDKDGKVTVTLDKAGTYLVSAYSDLNIVSPVCVVTVEGMDVSTDLNDQVSSVQNSDGLYVLLMAGCFGVICASVAVALFLSKKRGVR